MSEPYTGEIRMFGGSYAPRNWALCTGTIMSISNNNALYSLLGTNFGGDGRTTFGLPDMRGRIPVNQGAGPGLTPRFIGHQLGIENVTLTNNEMPTHNHKLQASTTDATSSNPSGDVLASQSDGDFPYVPDPQDPTRLQTMNSETVAQAGESRPHTNMMPYQCVSFIICLNGIYPSRN